MTLLGNWQPQLTNMAMNASQQWSLAMGSISLPFLYNNYFLLLVAILPIWKM
jgi:hypothetical protein